MRVTNQPTLALSAPLSAAPQPAAIPPVLPSGDTFVQKPKSVAPPEPSAPIQVMNWESLIPYIKRHVGFMQGAGGLTHGDWGLAFGEDYAPLAKGLSTEVDRLVAESLKSNNTVLQKVLETVFYDPELFKGMSGETREKIQQICSERLWNLIAGTPYYILLLQLILAGGMQDHLRIQEIPFRNFQRTPPGLRSVSWQETVLPYFKAILSVITLPQENARGVLEDQICASFIPDKERLFKILGEGMDPLILHAILQGEGGDAVREDSVAVWELDEVLIQAMKKIGYKSARPPRNAGENTASYTARVQKQRQAEIAKMSDFLYDRLFSDPTWTVATLTYLNESFKKFDLPPIVLP